MDSSGYLFVYGTLQNAVDNEMSRFLANHSEFVAKGYFYGKLYEVSHYPGAILSNHTFEKVFGSLYEITNKDHVFHVLDSYEGVNEGLFKRIMIDVYIKSEVVTSWVYLYNQPVKHLQRITSGDYLK